MSDPNTPAPPTPGTAILVVDDTKNIRLMTATVLKKAGYAVETAASADEAMAAMEKMEFALALIDRTMPGGDDGVRLVERAIARFGEHAPPAVLMTAYGSTDVAVAAMRAGAVDYMAKPFAAEELLHVVARNLRARGLTREVADLRARVDAAEAPARAGLVAASPAMAALMAMAGRVAASMAPVLVEGETGTGKERLARFVHDRSPRAAGPFVAVNCGALHPELLLSELFGHRRGAFTGAVEDRVGRFEAADGGTLFLDEVGELDEGAQVKLLRVLQEGTFERVGEGRAVRVDVRIVAATNRRLDAMAAEGSFRADLYYRLAVVTLSIPPLRERPEDLARLAEAFLAEFGAEAGRPGLAWSAAARRAMAAARWPGNIRELRNATQRAVLLAPPEGGEIDLAETPARGGLLDEAEAGQWSMEDLEREYTRRLLARNDLKLADVHRILKIDAATLWRKRKRWGM